MANDKEKITLNVPALRFPEFSGEWKRATIGECCAQLEYGMNAPSKRFDGENKYIRITDIDEDSCRYKTDDIVSPDGDLLEKYLVRKNDILLARTGASTGKAYLYNPNDGKMYYAGFLIKASVNSKYNSRYVFLQTQTKSYKKWVSITSMRSGQPGINSQEFAAFSFRIPPLRIEQDKISLFFEKLDERIATQKKIIDKLQSLINGTYKSIFAGINCNYRLDEICEVKKGQQVNGTELYEKGEYYVMNGGIEPSGFYDKFNTPADTISISEGGNSCGYVQFNNRPFWSGGHCYTLRSVDKQYNIKFLYHYLKANESEIMKLRIGSGLPNIQKKDLEAYCIPMISLFEQVRISKSIDAIQTKIAQSKDMLALYEKQKQYLLSAMFI